MWYRLTTFIGGEIDCTLDSQDREQLEALSIKLEMISSDVHCVITVL